MKKFDPNNFTIDKVFKSIDSKMKKNKVIDKTKPEEKVKTSEEEGIVVEVNV